MRYLAALLISFVLIWGLWTGLFYVGLGSNVTPSSAWIVEAYDYKDTLARQAAGPKILLVSGSNVLFGVDSTVLSERWGLPVVNHAVHAGLKMPYILSRAKDVLNEGDMVILPLEYELYLMDGRAGELSVDMIYSDVDYYRALTIPDKLRVIAELPLQRLVTALRESTTNEPTPRAGVGIYGVHNMNEAGDQINIEPEKMADRQVRMIDAIEPGRFGRQVVSRSFKRTFDGFLEWAKANGICVVITPPNRMWFEVYEEESNKRLFESILRYAESRGITFVGDPYDYMYPQQYYFDTCYHLNSRGVPERTSQMLRDFGDDPLKLCTGH